MRRGRYLARRAETGAEIAAAQALRHTAFRARHGNPGSGNPATGTGLDSDRFDDICQHMLIEDADGRLLCCFRTQLFSETADLGTGYSGQFYDLNRLSALAGAKLEIGRFCLRPDCHDPDVLRLAWGALTQMVDVAAVSLLFGCTSFLGADPALHRDALTLLAQGHVAPAPLAPGQRGPDAYAFARDLAGQPPAGRAALAGLPPLLRTYLMMGGWVSDHAVIDRDLDTLHVFTGVEIARIPAARARALRDMAG